MLDDKIKTKLRDRNLAQVARKIGISRSMLSYYVKGERELSVAVKERLVSYLLEN